MYIYTYLCIYYVVFVFARLYITNRFASPAAASRCHQPDSRAAAAFFICIFFCKTSGTDSGKPAIRSMSQEHQSLSLFNPNVKGGMEIFAGRKQRCLNPSITKGTWTNVEVAWRTTVFADHGCCPSCIGWRCPTVLPRIRSAQCATWPILTCMEVSVCSPRHQLTRKNY